ncbi:hypothetical protein R3P38DRAFT_560430 [Favolaschia claudopus]|uniref:Uncharacterized protein n=1 Tax=Favolaschia claudopus TaxID=2862362 RepID=A0AAV9Z9Z9_9AGAR
MEWKCIRTQLSKAKARNEVRWCRSCLAQIPIPTIHGIDSSWKLDQCTHPHRSSPDGAHHPVSSGSAAYSYRMHPAQYALTARKIKGRRRLSSPHPSHSDSIDVGCGVWRSACRRQLVGRRITLSTLRRMRRKLGDMRPPTPEIGEDDFVAIPSSPTPLLLFLRCRLAAADDQRDEIPESLSGQSCFSACCIFSVQEGGPQL